MKRKVLAVLFATALTAGMLSGCGSTDSTSDKADQKEESLEKETSEGQTGVDEETAANAVSEEEAEAAGFSDHEESADDQEASGDAEDTSHETEASADSSADSTEDTDSADGEFSDGSEDAQMAGTTVIDTSQQLTGTHHAAIIVKDYGEIDVELDADTAPITVTNFVKLVQDNFYDGLTFHRIIDGFMIQGGDPNGDGTVRSGAFSGMKLSAVWKEHPEVFGNYDCDRFPLLTKIIDARDDLSIQVHPDDDYAKVHENGSFGKTECWYIMDAPEGATLVIGHNAKNHEEVEEMIRGKRWKEFIREIPVKKGDFFQINPGCVHAIKGGTLILETQQNSDITYRVYDYDRLSDGKPRQLHVEQSIDTIVAPFEPAKCDTYTENLQGAEHKHLITCPFYSVDKYDVDGVFTIEFDKYFTDVSVVEGSGTVNGIPLEKGQHFIVPAGYGKCRFEGVMSLICSNPEKH